MKQQANPPEWVSRLNELGQRREPAFLLVDFEGQTPRLWSAAEFADQDEVHFSFPGRPDKKVEQHPDYPGDLLCGALFVTEAEYLKAYEIVHRGLQRGDSFLTNLTMPTEVELSASFSEIYRLVNAPYRVWLREQFVCFSPEIFVKISAKGRIASYPMKGTAEDTAAGRQYLSTSEKEIAEHATIVDLIRNDLSQVARRVKVDRYRYLDRIQTPRGALLQTSSEISGELPENWRARLGEIIARLLPAGSVSGAPKPATLDIISRAESGPRGYYCGIGLYFDGDTVDSCVLIRFIENSPEGKLIFRAGGGITARSKWSDEYAELIAKVRIPLSNKRFSLL